MGADLQSEQALLRQFRTLAGAQGPRMRLCDDMTTCDLLVIDERSAMKRAVLRLATTRPDLPLWMLDAEGALRPLASDCTPLSDDVIRRTLDSIAAQSRAASDDAGADAGDDAADAADPTDAATLMAAMRAHVLARRGIDALRMDGRDVLLLDYAGGSALLSDAGPEAIAERLATGATGLSLQPAADPGGDAPRKALPALLWQIGQHVAQRSEGWRIPGLGDDVALRLQRWPDVRVLAHHHDDFRLCSILVRQAATPAACAQLLDLDPQPVRSFFHAAYLSGYASADTAPAASTAPAEPPRRRVSALAGLWRSVRQKIGG